MPLMYLLRSTITIVKIVIYVLFFVVYSITGFQYMLGLVPG